MLFNNAWSQHSLTGLAIKCKNTFKFIWFQLPVLTSNEKMQRVAYDQYILSIWEAYTWNYK